MSATWPVTGGGLSIPGLVAINPNQMALSISSANVSSLPALYHDNTSVSRKLYVSGAGTDTTGRSDMGGIVLANLVSTNTDPIAGGIWGVSKSPADGLLYNQSSIEFAADVNGGYVILTARATGSPTPIPVAVASTAGFYSASATTLGRPTVPWSTVYGTLYNAGDSSGSELVWMQNNGDGLLQFGGKGGSDDTFFWKLYSGQRNTIYLQGNGSTAYNFYIADNANADATAGKSFFVKGQNKTAGTGNGGDVGMVPGTSSGGVKGHFFVPTCAGTPTETPATVSGMVALQYDTTNNKLFVYNGAWKQVTLA